jgi:hypothetical protein
MARGNRGLRRGFGGAVAPPPADRRDHAEDGDHDEQPEQYARRESEPAEGQRDELDDTKTDRNQRNDQDEDQKDALQPREDSGRGGGDEQPHRAQREHLATARRLLAEALDGVLEVTCAAFGECERRIGHAPELHPLLWARGCEGALEVAAGLLGVEALGGARAENGQRRRLVFGLALELLIRALLERLDGLKAAALLDPDLALLGSHRPSFYGLRNLRGSASWGPDHDRRGRARRYARRVSRRRLPSRHRAASLCVCGLVALAVAGAAPPAAMSVAPVGGNAFSELTEKAQQETTPTQTTASTPATQSTSNSNSSTVIVLALGAAVILLIGIAFVIVRDARKVAPAGDGQLTEARSARGSAARLRRRRARAKAARRQRKRNR